MAQLAPGAVDQLGMQRLARRLVRCAAVDQVEMLGPVGDPVRQQVRAPRDAAPPPEARQPVEGGGVGHPAGLGGAGGGEVAQPVEGEATRPVVHALGEQAAGARIPLPHQGRTLRRIAGPDVHQTHPGRLAVGAVGDMLEGQQTQRMRQQRAQAGHAARALAQQRAEGTRIGRRLQLGLGLAENVGLGHGTTAASRPVACSRARRSAMFWA